MGAAPPRRFTAACAKQLILCSSLAGSAPATGGKHVCDGTLCPYATLLQESVLPSCLGATNSHASGKLASSLPQYTVLFSWFVQTVT